MSLTVSYYQSSKKYDPLLTIGYTLAGILAAIVLGIIYSFISYISPIVVINIALVGGMGFTLAYITNNLAKLAKVRNTIVHLCMAFFICLFAYYSSICTFEINFMSLGPKSYIKLFFKPFTVCDLMFNGILPIHKIIISKGANTGYISGSMLKIIYLIELLAFFYPLLAAFKFNEYFCEDCRVWYRKFRFFSYSNENLESNITSLVTNNYAGVLLQSTLYVNEKLLASEVDKSTKTIDVLEYQYCQCPQCKQNSIFSIEKKKLMRKNKKEFDLRDVKKGILVKNVYIDDETNELLKQACDQL